MLNAGKNKQFFKVRMTDTNDGSLIAQQLRIIADHIDGFLLNPGFSLALPQGSATYTDQALETASAIFLNQGHPLMEAQHQEWLKKPEVREALEKLLTEVQEPKMIPKT